MGKGHRDEFGVRSVMMMARSIVAAVMSVAVSATMAGFVRGMLLMAAGMKAEIAPMIWRYHNLSVGRRAESKYGGTKKGK